MCVRHNYLAKTLQAAQSALLLFLMYDPTTDPPGIYRGRLSLPTCKMETTDPKIHHERPDSPGPGPSWDSMERDWSMPHLIMFEDGELFDQYDTTTDPPGIYRGRLSLPTCKMETTDPKIHHEGPDSPGSGPSCLSMKSGNSMPRPITFKDGEHDAIPEIPHEGPDSPGPSCVSMKSDNSMPRPITFGDGEHSDGP
ncbi:hypothetical protein NQZ68_038467, partial [Dissostichus eleginoides]